MDAPFLMWVALALLLAYLIKSVLYQGKRLKHPPGPTGLPLVGYMPFLKPSIYRAFMNLTKRYGNVFQVTIGSFQIVVVNGKAGLREAFTEKIESFAGRPDTFSSRVAANGHSVFLSSKYDAAWKLQKRICENTLHRFADTHSGLIHEIIIGEGNSLVNTFLSHKGEPFDPSKYILEHVGSIIYQICYGQSPNVRDDERFKVRMSRQRKVAEFWGSRNPVEMMPWTRYFLPWIRKQYRSLVEANTEARMGMLQEHAKTFDPDNPRDLADGLLLASTEYSKEDKEAVGITDNQIFANLEGVEGGGFETVNHTLRWMVLFMAKFSTIQDKARMEINDVIGSISPHMSHQSKLPYTEATILEIMRMANIVPLVLHSATTDATLMGYDVPKGTRIIGNLYSTAFDEEFWGDPECFRPERFLGENGDVDREKATYFLPFSAGRRRCIGEKVAKAEIFLLFVTILQRCRITKPRDEKLDTTAVHNVFRSTKPYQVIIEEIA